MPFQIIRNDITKVKADAIVNTANPNVAIGGGVDSAIYKAAGADRLLQERQKIGRLEPGEVAITPAFDLYANFIIHASGPWWRGGENGEAEILRQCYDKSLQLAADNNCRSIAFPLLATGSYGFPQRLGIEIAVESFTRFLKEYDMDIYLVVFGRKSVRLSGELVDDVQSFIDDGYVSEALAEEYHHDTSEYGKSERTVGLPVGKEKPYESVVRDAKDKKISLDEVLKEIYTDSFEKHLRNLIAEKGLKNSDVYVGANISKQYFSKLLKGQVKPSKEKVLALAVGLKLNIDEAVDFLRIGGYAFSPVSQTDAVVKHFIERENYSVININIVLFEYGLDQLSN